MRLLRISLPEGFQHMLVLLMGPEGNGNPLPDLVVDLDGHHLGNIEKRLHGKINHPVVKRSADQGVKFYVLSSGGFLALRI